MKPIRVLVVDDSLTMRSLICAALGNDPSIEVVGQAADAIEARSAIKALNPDVITLDVEMPKMDGLALLEKLMRLRPTPVIMVSNLTSRGADSTLRAFELGAVDCVAKPSPGNAHGFDELAAKVKAAASARLRGLSQRASPSPPENVAHRSTHSYEPDGRVVVIGSSTGGVEALLNVLSHFPANCPPTVITQHMPALFTKSFAERLDRHCAPKVAEASEGARLQSGQIYLAPGSVAHLEIVGRQDNLRCHLSEGDLVSGHRPSVDMLFSSAAKAAGSKAVGVILTGMGQDGARGLLAMRNAGASTFGQDEATSVVYGMPRVAFELGAVEKQVSLRRMGEHILACTQSKREA
ncbi:MAG: chemotaxis response regulator protein-glutamate methylesterase [Hyphomicrobiales bacterium]